MTANTAWAMAATMLVSAPLSFAQTVLAHHVVLEGSLGDQAKLRRELEERHRGCVHGWQSVGVRVHQPTMPSLPQVVSVLHQHVYYAPDRIVEEASGSNFRLKRLCEVEETPYHWRKIHTSKGVCEIDFVRREARGPCRSEDRRVNPSSLLPQSPARDFRTPTGEHRVIAGMPCEVFRDQSAGFLATLCVARPHSRFQIGSSGLSQGAHGLLLALETDPPTVSVQATRVSLHEQVPLHIFEVPAGMRFLWVTP